MTIDVSASQVLTALIVASLVGTAKILWSATVELAKLKIRVDEHDRRLDGISPP